MRVVWETLTNKRRVRHKSTKEFLHPVVTSKSRGATYRARADELRRTDGISNENKAHLLEREATTLEGMPETGIESQWSEQELALRILFTDAYDLALDIPPVVTVSEARQTMTDLWNTSICLREGATKLRELGMEDNALQVERIAASCEEEAYWAEPDEQLTPVVVHRDHGENSVRSYVAYLAGTTQRLFGKPLYGTLANISNVAFDRTDITDDRIHDMLRAMGSGA
jgi:hypothetical protein